MYSAPYGFPNAAAGGAGGPNFNGAPPPQNPHMQSGPMMNQPPQMMFNPQQQFAMGAQGGYPAGGPNHAAMMGGAGPAGMMPNAAMPHMGANGQMAYQTPYAGAPYGAGGASPAGPHAQLPPNYMMAGNMPPQFQGNPAAMAQQQQMMQRMHPSQQNPHGMGMSTPNRAFSGQQGTSRNSIPGPQGQYPGPANAQGTPQGQTPTNAQQPTSSVATPQTPTFPTAGQLSNVNGTSSSSTPLSPGTESREKERFSLILDINRELLYESIQLTRVKSELKKEHAGGDGANGQDTTEEEKLIIQDYASCMRRLQGNLNYLAALADRKGGQPQCPAYLTSPPLNMSIKMKAQALVDPNTEKQAEPSEDREERDKSLKEMYKQLQALFPGIDPKREPAFQPGQQGARPPGQQQNPNNGQRPTGNGQSANQGSPASVQNQAQRSMNASANMASVG